MARDTQGTKDEAVCFLPLYLQTAQNILEDVNLLFQFKPIKFKPSAPF